MTSEVFKPSNGELFIRDNLAQGVACSADMFKKSRPESKGGYRFGQLSHNSFFTRHRPHPARVGHLKGLLDVPICCVNDDGFVSNPRFSLKFPPNNHEDVKINNYAKFGSVPVNSINVNSQRHPINTITGLQFFQGKPLNMRIYREKAVPRIGMVPVEPTDDGWRDELKGLTDALGIRPPAANHPQQPGKPATARKPRTSQYSSETGRLIPPPSRAMSRGFSRSGSRAASRQEQFMNKLDPTQDPEFEAQILQMLMQILQTDDLNAVKAWLVNGPEREKEMVLNMIRAALDNNDQYYKQNDVPDYRVTEEVGRTLGSGAEADRLTLDGDEPRPITPSKVVEPPTTIRKAPSSPPIRTSPIPEEQDATRAPVLPDIFKPPKSAGEYRPNSRVGSKTPSLKYTRMVTPINGDDTNAVQLQNILDNKDQVWEPQASFAVNE